MFFEQNPRVRVAAGGPMFCRSNNPNPKLMITLQSVRLEDATDLTSQLENLRTRKKGRKTSTITSDASHLEHYHVCFW